MSITLQMFAAGDIDYIAKFNADFATIQAAINGLQLATAGATNSPVSVGEFFTGLFAAGTGIIGANSYGVTPSGNNLIVTGGYAYKGSTQAVVSSITTSLGFIGQPPNTYYVTVDTVGTIASSDVPTDALYSVVWNGSAFGAITRVAPILFDITEQQDARDSTLLGPFATLDDRLEAAEAATAVAQATADAVSSATSNRIRKVGCSLDGGTAPITTGIKGSIPIDFNGTIVGWSVIADQVGTLEVEVSRGRSSPPAIPPDDPPIPDTVISASAPIELGGPSGQQSAAADDTGLTGWDPNLLEWDTLQFNVTAASLITKATLYLRIVEY